jgi:uncharacterized protein
MSPKVKPADVDAYIAAAAPEARPHLNELRTLVTSTVPEAEEGISWNVPFYKLHGPLVGFSAFKHHVSFGLGAGALDPADSEALAAKGYTSQKRTVQIRFDQKIPTANIKNILKAQARINATKSG